MINKTHNVPIFIPYIAYYRKGGAVMRALASHQCGQESNLSVDAICGFSLLFVLSLALLREVSLRVLWFSPLLKN